MDQTAVNVNDPPLTQESENVGPTGLDDVQVTTNNGGNDQRDRNKSVIADADSMIKNIGGYAVVILAFSIIVLTNACFEIDIGNFSFGDLAPPARMGIAKFAVAVGAIPTFITAFQVANAKYNLVVLTHQINLGISVFLFAWYFISIFVLQFNSPEIYKATSKFNFVGTAYFSLWGAFLASSLELNRDIEKFQTLVNRVQSSAKSNGPITYLMLANIIIGYECIVELIAGNGGPYVLPLIVASVSLLINLIYFFKRGLIQGKETMVTTTLLAMWFFGTLYFTLKKPFILPGNSQVACWLAVYSSFQMHSEASAGEN